MAIEFPIIPTTLRSPLFYAEVDNTNANTAQLNQRALIIGQITSSGAATPNVPLISQGPADAITQGGNGSQLALMTAYYRNIDTFGEVWYLPLLDAGGAVAATGTVTLTAAPTAAGVFNLYVAGTNIALPVLPTQTTSQIATALAAAINAAVAANTTSLLPVTAAAATNVVTITARNAGLAGNDIDLRVNYRGTLGGEVTPTGMTWTLSGAQLTGGLTNPTTTLTTALANLLDQPFDFIITPWNDSASLAQLAGFLSDVSGRWSYANQLYGHVYGAYRGTLSARTTFGTSLNNQHTSIMGFYDSPTPSWLWAAALGAASAMSVRADPGLPHQTLVLQNVLAPPLVSRDNLSARNTMLYDGISTFTVDGAGAVHIDNLITTYQTNAFGQPDNSYLQIERMWLLTYVLRAMAGLVTSKYGRCKLAANGTRVSPGSNVVTPNIIRADLIAEYQTFCDLGICQNPTAFAAGLIVQQNALNSNRVDVLWDGQLINQLQIFALLAQFR